MSLEHKSALVAGVMEELSPRLEMTLRKVNCGTAGIAIVVTEVNERMSEATSRVQSRHSRLFIGTIGDFADGLDIPPIPDTDSHAHTLLWGSALVGQVHVACTGLEFLLCRMFAHVIALVVHVTMEADA